MPFVVKYPVTWIMIQTKVGSNILLSQDFLFQKLMLQILDLEAELFEDEIDKDLEHHFRK